jgi:hypothetical protein
MKVISPTLEKDIIWLAGFFDGEGTISLPVEKKTGVIVVRVSIPNTNFDNLRKAQSVLSALLNREVKLGKDYNKDHRPCKNIRLKNQAETKLLLETLLPYLAGKKPQAELMLYYLSIAPGKGNRFNQEHYNCVSKMRNLNRRYAKGEWERSQQETERVAPNSGEETVRTSQQCEEPLLKAAYAKA